MTADVADFRSLVAASRDERATVRALATAGRGLDAEPDPIRAADYASRQISAESLTGPTNDIQTVAFIVQAAVVRRAVGFVEAPNSRGSGFLISPDLFITNQHVVANAAMAKGTRITFDYERDLNRLPIPTSIFSLDPDRFALFSDERELDYAVVALGPRLLGTSGVTEFGFCPLSNRPDKHAVGMNVNIIQHPSGLPKMVAVRNNLLTHRTARTLLYETDTEHGSSGSPVFNDFWEVVALHHYGEPFLELKDEFGKPIETKINEGVRISTIYDHLTARLNGLSHQQRSLLEQALAYDKQQPQASDERKLTPPRHGTNGSENQPITGMEGGPMTEQSRQIRIALPLEITISLGASGATAAESAQVLTPIAAVFPAAEPMKTLSHGAEAIKIDPDYDNREGYNPKFIPGLAIPLPVPNATLAKHVAPLLSGQLAGELKYEHFSLKLNKAKRIAIFTATNIDGKTYLVVDRKTGKVSEGPEGDKWFSDPRIDSHFYLDQTFYGDWSDYFDRGHLTRRTDPTWGKAREAERANADTFHFTNCSPQHFRFNESAKFWQGAERYVLENGVLSTDSKTRITVFQGPIFNSELDMWAEDTQIPSAFFKVIVWKGKNGVSSVGLIVDQSPLLSETRKSMGKPKELPSVNVKQWRVPVSTIEQKTGLSFGKIINDADTIAEPGQPSVGEALIAVRDFDDLLPGHARQ